jgi:hypothetical protein
MRRLLALPFIAALPLVMLGSLAAPVVAAAPPTSYNRLPVVSAKTDAYGTWFDHSITGEQFSSPAVGDVTGDGQPDVVAGYPDGNVYVLNAATLAREYKRYVGPGAVLASPNLVDLNGDGRLDIVVATSNGTTRFSGGNVIAFDTDGKVLFSQRTVDNVHQSGNFATPQAADLDHDGQKEVIETSWDHHIYAWKLNGTLLGSWFAKDTIWSTPVIADLNGDGWLEVAFGYDCDGVSGQDCFNGVTYGRRGGYMIVLDHTLKNIVWRKFYNGQVVWSSPAVADLNRDGVLDLIVGTGNMSGVNLNGGHQVLAFRGTDGAYLPGFPVNVGGKVMGSPAVGDINGDGRLDIAVVADDGRLYDIDNHGHIMWSRCTANDLLSCPRGLHGSPVIADVDGNGQQDVVVGGEQHVFVFNGSGNILNTHRLGALDPGANFMLYSHNADGTMEKSVPFSAAPTVANVIVHGKTQTMIYTAGGTPAGSGADYNFGRVWGWTTGTPMGRASWPSFRNFGAGRTGSPDVTAPARGVYALPATSHLTFKVVSWGNDPGTGVSSIETQVSDNNAAWRRIGLTGSLFRSGTFASTAVNFVPVKGHSYKLRSIVMDRMGNAGVSGLAATVGI